MSIVSIYGNFSSLTIQHLNFSCILLGNGFNNFTYNWSPTTTLLTKLTHSFWLKFKRYVQLTFGVELLLIKVCFTLLIKFKIL